ncbi:MAG: AAA family ATPase [Aquabacterium sp.]|uniref:AAA family ATPase n=1 Tax=Aquabacterium sp. TaxID=1872578 RepID=UPI003BD5DA11
MSAGQRNVIAVVGAESTGKTSLVQELVRLLVCKGLDVAMVPEVLREFCDDHDRTPHVHEQLAIARAQTARIEHAAKQHAWVVADTTALMTAVYSDYIFQDPSLYEEATRDHAGVALTLLTSLDVSWTPDGFIRDGAHVREPVDALIRQALMANGLSFQVVAGTGVARVNHALSAVEHLITAAQRSPTQAVPGRSTWRWFCDNCDDGECEQHWLTRLR